MKKILFIIIGSLIVLSACSGEENSQGKDGQQSNEAATENTDDNSKEKENNYALSEQDAAKVKEGLEEELSGENEEGYGDFDFFLDDFEYDGDNNTINARIAVEKDPMPSQKEVREYTQDIAWYAGSTIVDKDFVVYVSSVLKFDEDEYGFLGIGKYENGDTSFTKKDGFDLLN